MIDVVFNLLVFFVWTASFQAVERSLPSTLTAPAGSGVMGQVDPDLIDFDRVVIRLRWQVDHPTWQINDRQVAQLAALRQALAAISAVRTVPLVIDSGPDVPLGHVIDVYDAARLEGFGEVQFAATEDS
jgi:biopolymer transport protein ExbD